MGHMQTPIALIGSDFVDGVLPLIAAAKENIRIVIFDWRFYPDQATSPVSFFNNALIGAVRRGVKARCLVQSEALKAQLLRLGFDVRIVHTRGLVHAKMLVIDDKKVVLGSHNYTQNGFSMNQEVSCAFEMEEEGNDFAAYFDRLWGV